ncbi:MAG: hypothetical protein AAF636_27905 [Pseudomonadota bacterium]
MTRSEEKNPTVATQRIVEALAKAEAEQKLRAEAEKLAEKDRAINRARAVIYQHIGRWIGEQIAPGDPIPMLRNGEKVGEIELFALSRTWGADPIDPIANAALMEDTTELKERVDRLVEFVDAANTLMESMSKFRPFEVAQLQATQNVDRSTASSASLAERIISEIGFFHSALISTHQLHSSAKGQKDTAQQALERRHTGRGRPRNEAAHAVALELAKLFAKITGEKPTYSEDENGFHGHFSPALRDVFNSLGWKKVSIKNPALKAIEQITEDDLGHPKNTGIGGILGLPRKFPPAD